MRVIFHHCPIPTDAIVDLLWPGVHSFEGRWRCQECGQRWTYSALNSNTLENGAHITWRRKGMPRRSWRRQARGRVDPRVAEL